MMPEWAMCEIACICEEKGIGIYIDDLAMKVNNVPENIEYFQKIIKHLHHYIKAVKVDYEWVHRMKGDPSVKRHISLNLHDFWYIWKSYTNISLPRVIFESVPFDRIDAMNIIFEMTAKYKYGKCHFQSEEEPVFRRKKIF